MNLSDFLATHATGWEEFSESGRDVFEALRGVSICINSIECRQQMRQSALTDDYHKVECVL